jgi:hypothetical protein
MNKLKLKQLRNAIAIPIIDGDKSMASGVLQVYNSEETAINEIQL